MDVLSSLICLERSLIGTRVLAPVTRGGRIRLSVDGLVWECRAAQDFEGWGVFEVRADLDAHLLRPAHARERMAYARRFRREQATLLGRARGDAWWALLGERTVLARLVEGADVLDRICVVRDGGMCWFVSAVRTPRARRLREALSRGEDVDDRALRLARGLSAPAPTRLSAPVPTRLAARLRSALAHAGASLLEFRELDRDLLDVAWERDGLRHSTRIRGSDLSVVSSGICLSGRDADFDLASIVGVMAERAG